MAKKRSDTEEEKQQVDLTELVNYVNYLGQKLEELGQVVQPPTLKFGMEQVETEGELRGIKYFHVPVVMEVCGDISANIEKFYMDKYGTVPQVVSPDFYVF